MSTDKQDPLPEQIKLTYQVFDWFLNLSFFFQLLIALGFLLVLKYVCLKMNAGRWHFIKTDIDREQISANETIILQQMTSPDKQTRQGLADQLTIIDTYLGSYRHGMKRLLLFFHKIWGKPIKGGQDIQHYLTVKSLDRCLQIAIIYPILVAMAIWFFSKQPLMIAGVELADALPRWQGIIGTLTICCIAWFLWEYHQTNKDRHLTGSTAASVIAVVTTAGSVASAVAGAGVDAVTAAVTAAGFSGAVSFALGSAGAGAGAGVVAVVFAFASTDAGNIAVAGAFLGAGAVAVAIYFIIKKQNKLIFYITVMLIPLLLYGFIILNWGTDVMGDAFYLLYVLLPLVNALFDWLSLAATRYYLKRNLDEQGNMPHNTAYDIAIACFCAISVTLVSIGMITFYNILAVNIFEHTNPPLDIENHIAMIREFNWNNFAKDGWLVICFYSTLLPTVLHLALMVVNIVGGGVVTTNFKALRQQIANGYFVDASKQQVMENYDRFRAYFYLAGKHPYVPRHNNFTTFSILDSLIMLCCIALGFYILFAWIAPLSLHIVDFLNS